MNLKLSSNNSWLKDNGFTLEEEIKLYNEQLEDIINNPRWYLDNCNRLKEYRVSWKSYRLKSATLPHHLKITIQKKQH